MAIQKQLIPFEATHPGILIKDELDARLDINQKDLAKELGVLPSFLNEIIKGKRPITADLAILLEKSLEIPADYWMRFQSQYEIDLARLKEKNIKKIENIEIWSVIKNYVPVHYFKKQGYLNDSLEDDIRTIKSIYKVENIDGLVTGFANNRQAFYRKSDKLLIDEKNMFAWSTLAQYEAKKQKVNSFNFDNLAQLCLELNKIFYENNDTLNKVKATLNKFGVKLVLIQKLDKTPIDGFSFWSENNPAIAITLRYSRIDNFAFTMMHEIGHIDLHLQKNKNQKFLDLTKKEQANSIEKEADNFAQEKLISTIIWNEIKNNYEYLNDEIIIELGDKFKINPAILFGRVCFEMSDYAFKTVIDKKMK